MAKQVRLGEQIGEYVFDLYPLAPSKAVVILSRISKLFAEPLAILGDSSIAAFKKGAPKPVTGGGDEGEGELPDVVAKKTFSMADFFKMEFNPDMLGRAANALVTRMNEGEILDTVKALVEPFHIKAPGDAGTRRLNFELDFRGDMGLLMAVLSAAIEVNFGDFLSAVSGNLGSFRRTASNSTRAM